MPIIPSGTWVVYNIFIYALIQIIAFVFLMHFYLTSPETGIWLDKRKKKLGYVVV
jgi:hypothetical protein